MTSWLGDKEQGERLVAEAKGDSPVVFQPADERVMIFPVVPDETKPVDITVLQLGGQDLPEMGVICGVGFDVNAAGLAMIYELECGGPVHGGDISGTATGKMTIEAILAAKLYSVGDIVCINKFSGMDVPGTNFLLCSRRDILGKLLNFPVKLRTDQARWDALEEAKAAHEGEDRAAAIGTPHTVSTVIPSSKG